MVKTQCKQLHTVSTSHFQSVAIVYSRPDIKGTSTTHMYVCIPLQVSYVVALGSEELGGGGGGVPEL